MNISKGRAVVAIASLLLAMTAAADHDSHDQLRAYAVHNLVSDGSTPADRSDPNLRNGWGVAFNPTGFVWVADNGTSLSTLYDGTGLKQSLVVAIPAGTHGTASPTGIVFSASSDFQLVTGNAGSASRFLFAGENGTISGWSPAVNVTNAILKYDAADGAVYKGLALASNGTGNFLYATDFHNAKVDVFDAKFNKVTLTGNFVDPNLPANYAPFGIQNVLGNLYITYAKQGASGVDDVAGRGLGFVDVFDSNGNLLRRVASRGALNSPWGIALAPADFGRFSGRLLIGNFGDGAINAYDIATGQYVGSMRGANGRKLHIDGLWGMQFGNGVQGQDTHSLFFAAGPNDEASGLYGRIEAVPGNGRDDHDDRDDD